MMTEKPNTLTAKQAREAKRDRIHVDLTKPLRRKLEALSRRNRTANHQTVRDLIAAAK